MRNIWVIGLLGLLTACTPPEESYCGRMGTPVGTPEYGKCVNYFFTQTAAFNTDKSFCEMDADQVYPMGLYDTWKSQRIHGGYYVGRYYSGYTVETPPDMYHNQMVDTLRMRIVGPCMQQKGWASPYTWEAGRIQTPMPVRKTGPLPWKK